VIIIFSKDLYMEVIVATGLLGVGYLLNNNTPDKFFRQFDPKIEIPSINKQQQSSALVTNFYNTSHALESRKVEQNYKKARDAVNTNVIPPYFNNAVFNDQTTSVQYLERPIAERSTKIDTINNDTKNTSTLENFYEPLIAQPGYANGPEYFSSLAGQNIDNFTHNNQVPFFKGSNKQSIDPYANQSILENFGGINTFKLEKKAVEPLFKPTKDFTHVNGTPGQTNEVIDRFVPSLYRTNETPTNPIKVGPGLNKGFTAEPTGGFQQFSIQDFALPKTTDELRTLNNPKLTYEGRATGAPIAAVTNRGLQGTVKHRHPDRFFIQTPDRYFTTTAANLKPQMPGKFDARATARQDSVSYEGAAGPASTFVESLRPSVRDSSNINFTTTGMRNVNLQNNWEGDKFDFNKSSFFARPNERETTEDKTIISNLTSLVKSIIAPILDVFRTTRKENVLGNPNKVGYMSVQGPTKPIVWDPNDVARTTIKETNINNNHTGNMGNNRKKVPVFDPNDIARTTIKETNIHNNHSGNMGNNNKKVPVFDPNDIARTTLKETNIHNNQTGNMGNNNKKVPVFDPNDLARTTIKETNIHNNQTGNLSSYARKTIVYDPNDTTRTTIKETNIHNNQTGNMGNNNKKVPVFDPNDIARTTIKETNIHNNQTGNLSSYARKTIVYDPNDTTRTTIKETNIHNNHSGNMGNNNKKVPVFDPNDIARTTLKETNIHNNQTGNLSSYARKTIVYDPNDTTRTTIKETNIHNTHSGNMGNNSKKVPVFDPNDIARTTLKETNIHNNHSGNMGNNNKKVPVFDPNDIARTTLKETNIHNNHSGNMGNNSKKVPVFDPNDIARTTLKETNIHNNHSGNMGNNSKKVPVFDPNDIARTTLKETNIHNNHSGNMGNNNKKVPVFDPNDIARTTLKETNIHNNHSGNMGNNNKKTIVHDPNDIARTTLKETNIHNNHSGHLQTTIQKGKSYDPNDILKTTIKETNIHNNHSGNMSGNAKKITVHDPNDIARTTIKETNIHNKSTGNFGSSSLQNGTGYKTTNFDAPNTNRQFTSDFEYSGIADGQTTRGPGDGYLTTSFDAPNTNRQFTSDFEYSGVAKNYLERPTDDEMWDNARLNETRTGVSEGRYPTLSNTKLSLGSKDINMEAKKLEDDRLNKYSPAANKLYIQTPSLSKCTVTTDKDQLPNESLDNRIDPNLLTAFNDNPYTQPLNSF